MFVIVRIVVPGAACTVSFTQEGFHTVQSQICVIRTDQPSLWTAPGRRKKSFIVYISALQELFHYPFIRWNVLHHPFMADVIKTALDIPFQNPFRGNPS